MARILAILTKALEIVFQHTTAIIYKGIGDIATADFLILLFIWVKIYIA